MNQALDSRPEPRVTLAERWAARMALQSSFYTPILVVAGAVALFAAFRDALMLVILLFVAAAWWERLGFKRLLARKDAEIADLKSNPRNA
jgi:hypothetical protein